MAVVLSLKQLSAKCSGPSGLPTKGDRIHRPKTVLDENDPDWTGYYDMIRTSSAASSNDITEFLRAEFAKRSKEQGKCIEYLKKLIVHTFDLCKANIRKGDKSVFIIITSLFDIAQVHWSLPSQVIDDMITQGMNSIRDFSSSVLSSIVMDYCLKQLSEATVAVSSRWIEMFGRFMSTLNDRGDIPSDTDTISGKRFRELVVQEICRMDWNKDSIHSVLAVLEETPGLEGYEIDLILERYSTFLQTSKQEWGSSIIYSTVAKVVLLTGNLRPSLLLQTLDKYIQRLQSLRAQSTTNAISTAPSNMRGKKRGQQAVRPISMGVIACNFVEAARNSDPILKEVLKRTKAAMFDHTLIMTPFTLSVVLGLSCVDHLKVVIIDSLKTAILRSLHEINLSNSSCWYKSVIGDIPNNILTCFEEMLRESDSVMEYMCDGLKQLGINLLSHNLHWKYPDVHCEELGQRLVLGVVQGNKERLALILKELLKPESPAHIECLSSCLQNSSRAIGMRNFQGRIGELIQYLPSMSVESASLIVKSLMPSLRMTPTLLDDLMIVLRKTFWKSVEAGRICVEVMCVILCKSLVVGSSQLLGAMGGPDEDLILSQCTQNTSQSGSDFSPLCHEILDLAKRFFQLDVKVREQLYLGLHRVARKNPILNDVICGQVHAHFVQYLAVGDVENKIIYRNIFEFNPTSTQLVIVKDELGFLVQCMGFVFNKSKSLADYGDGTASYRNCKEAMETLVSYASKLNVDYLETTASDIIGDGNSQFSQQQNASNSFIKFVKDTLLMQTMQICEALMEFLCVAPDWKDASKSLKNIFLRHQELVKYCKEQAQAPKKGKKEKGKTKTTKKADKTKVNDDDDAVSLISGTTSASNPGRSKKAEPTIKAAPYFRLMNLDSVCMMLREMYKTNTKSALKSLVGFDEFELLLLRTALDKIELSKSHHSIRERPRERTDFINTIQCLSDTIWKRFVKMIDGWEDQAQESNNSSRIQLDESTEVVEVRLQVIFSIIELLLARGFMSKVLYLGQDSKKDIGEEILRDTFFNTWKNILRMVMAVFDGAKGKGAPLLFKIMNSFCKLLSNGDDLKDMNNWTWEFIKSNTDKPESGTNELVNATISFYLTCNSKCFKTMYEIPDVFRLSKIVRTSLGDVEDDEDAMRAASWLLTPDTAPTLLSCLITYLENHITMLNTILGRLKAHRQYLGDERSLEMRDSCLKIIQCLSELIIQLARSRLPAGACVAQMVKLVTQFYTMLSNFAEHYVDINKFTTDCPLESYSKLVTHLGKQFKPRIEAMIEHIAGIQSKIPIAAAKPNSKKPPKVPIAIKHQLSKDAKLIPNMIFQMEMFDKHLINLSKKRKDVKLLVGMKLSTARDFRVEATHFQNAVLEMNRTNANAEADIDQENETIPATAPKRGKKRKNTDPEPDE